jgi:hypothetical protein
MPKETNQEPKERYLESKIYMEQASRNYEGAAWLTIAFYIFAVWIGGVIANVIFFVMAKKTARIIGKKPPGYLFLLILLILNVIPVSLIAYLIASYLTSGP